MINHKKIVGGYIFAMAALFLSDMAFYRFAPIDWFFKYHSVDFVEYDKGTDSLVFASSRDVYRRVTFDGNDILFCKKGDAFLVYANFPWKGDAQPLLAADKKGLGTWRWSADFPRGAHTCYIDATPAVVFKYGIRRAVEYPIRTPVFSYNTKD